MRELIRTNDVVLISFVEALLNDAGMTFLVLDENMSILEGSIGAIPRRVMVEADRLAEACALLSEAGVGAELSVRGGAAT